MNPSRNSAHDLPDYVQPTLLKPWPFFRMGREPVGVDILTEIAGVDFDTAWARRVEAVIDSSGLKTSFISREDLIAAKLASGRPQDLADVDAIRKAQESKEQ